MNNDTDKPFKIETLWAYCAVDENGVEGTPMMFQPQDGTWVAMIAADKDRLKCYRPEAVEFAKKNNQKVIVKRFDTYVVEEVINP